VVDAIDSQFDLGAARLTKLNRLVRYITITLAILALAFSGALLIKDAGLGDFRTLTSSFISAISLLLAGVGYLIVQLIMRLRLSEFLKNVLLAMTFILWGIVQLMPQNALSARLGNLVVALYVLDAAWAILLITRPTNKSQVPMTLP
jgi:hypothetical protein